MATATPVDPSNLSQLKSWDGAGGGFWVDNADRFDKGVAGYRPSFMAAAAIEETSHVLDIGCGTGQETRDAARAAPAGAALGVDLSSGMVELARRRAQLEGLGNVSFEQADAQVRPFSAQGFDVAISRHGAMFFGDPVAAFTNIGLALRPGGRLVLLTWQPFERQDWLSSFFTALAGGGPVPVPPSDAPSPFALSDPERVRALLVAAGFVDVHMDGHRGSALVHRHDTIVPGARESSDIPASVGSENPGQAASARLDQPCVADRIRSGTRSPQPGGCQPFSTVTRCVWGEPGWPPLATRSAARGLGNTKCGRQR
ncbi:MAG: class I SAM-dependent methyltransferase [Actinobacteria bacterium]|nr:class I SAM-dependent methyltransferase [Actinomycetota bacterium]